MKWKITPLSLSLMILSGAAHAATVPPGTELAATQNIVINNGTEVSSLDPQKTEGVPESRIISNLLEGLVTTDNTGAIVPGVAQSWQNEGGKVWTFTLRDNAKWSNGAPVTAHDFVYSWRRLADPKTASPYASYLQAALHTGFNQALLSAVISNLGFAAAILPAGWLSDKIGRRRVMVTASVLLLLLAFPLLNLLQADTTSTALRALVVFVAGGIVGMLAGPGPAMLAEMFPTHVRYTGLGLAYSLSNAIFSGCAGLIITGLMRQTGNLDIPAWYVMATALVTIPALMTLKNSDAQQRL